MDCGATVTRSSDVLKSSEKDVVESRASIMAQTLTQDDIEADNCSLTTSTDDGQTTAGRVKDAVARLVPNWDPCTEVVVESMVGGCTGMAFKVNQVDNRGSFFVKLFSDEHDVWTSVENTRLIGLAGLGPELIGADGDAMVQALVPGKWLPSWHEWSKLPQDQQSPSPDTIGKFFAAMHRIKIETEAPITQRCFGAWTEIPKWVEYETRIREEVKGPLLDVYKYLDSRPDATGVGGEKVFYHGDAHMENMLLQEGGTILAVDLDLSGVGPRVADLAFFFWHWDWFGKGGKGGYPSSSVRQSIVHSYLGASGLSAEGRDVQQMLLDIEYEVARVAMCRLTHCEKPSEVMLPFMHKALCEADEETNGKQGSMENYIVEQGIMAVAFEKAVLAGVTDAKGYLHIR